MTKALILTQLDSGRKFVLGGPTQIGRLDRENKKLWAVPGRPRPELFSRLDAIITLSGNDCISRNHAGIYPDEDTFYILDLHSLNHTYVNGKVLCDRPQALNAGDRIQFSEQCPEFEVEFGDLENHALLVAAGEDHPGAMKNYLDRLERHLRRRGYICHTLMGHGATKEAVRAKLNELKYLIHPGAQFFFSFHGHGGPNGLQLGNKIMNPRELYEKLRPIRGSKAVVLDACHAGLFANEDHKHRIPEETLVLCGCGPGQKASETETPDQQFCPRFIDALARYLEEHPGAFDLRDFFDDLGETWSQEMTLQGPMMQGQRHQMPKEVTQLLTVVTMLDKSSLRKNFLEQTSPGFKALKREDD